jgi:hypothetical protein
MEKLTDVYLSNLHFNLNSYIWLGVTILDNIALAQFLSTSEPQSIGGPVLPTLPAPTAPPIVASGFPITSSTVTGPHYPHPHAAALGSMSGHPRSNPPLPATTPPVAISPWQRGLRNVPEIVWGDGPQRESLLQGYSEQPQQMALLLPCICLRH